MTRTYKSISQMKQVQGNNYFKHYMRYLTSIAYQMFKWEGLPPSVDERFLEMTLHNLGYVGFVRHPKTGDILVAQGAMSGMLDIYGYPTSFDTVFPNGSMNFKVDLFNFMDDKKDDKNGVIVYNNFLESDTISSLQMFAEELAHVKQVTRVNINNQKTPWIMVANDKNYQSIKKFESQLDSDLDRIIVNDKLDLDNLKVHLTPSPYVADKLNEHLTFIWGDLMTFLGIGSANVLKRERMVVDEVNSKEEQTKASENMWLVTRQQACEKINELFGLNVSVKIRTEIVDELQEMYEREVSLNG